MMANALLLAAALTMTSGRQPSKCVADARTQALKLLLFHVDGDERAAIEPDSARQIGTVASLTGRRRFDVIEVYGNVYKGHYRMRLIYAHLPGTCVLMGQEIFELSDL